VPFHLSPLTSYLSSMPPLRVGGGRTNGSDEGSLDVYLRDIARYPLISRDEEAMLARRIRCGDQEALDTLIRSNLRFVVSVAKRYQHQGVSLPDLINEGNLGLIRAAHKFDETKEIKFISYAVWWIRQSILQALADQSRIVRVPLNRAGEMHRIGRRTSALQQQLGRDPTAGEIAEGTDLDVVDVERALAISRAHVSFDAPTTTGDDARLLDHIADVRGRGADADAIDHARTECIEAVLGSLREREARVVRLYFGLDSAESYTLEQIGEMMGITRERVRQIKDKALMRLRLASEGHALDSFLG
jgi:RNA polymerase primary sigma factor